ncbi:MAG: hypothetical protein LBJ36_09700 [Synergistaceae bacterium]|nr:hypothetical protein [Synergistaceae bacterium]
MLFYENADFFRVTAETANRIPSFSTPKRVKYTVTLAPLKSVAIFPFAFPFNNVFRIREALKLQVLPYASVGEMELFPSLLDKTSRSSSGVAWFVPSADLESVRAPIQVENRVWPAPLPLVSQVEGEGATFWLDEENICSMLWRGGVPVLYRWKSRKRASEESELAWYEAYCKSKEEEIGNTFTLDATRPEIASLSEIVKKSLDLYPWIGEVNLSRSALDSALVLERTVSALSRVASWLLLMGLFVLGGNVLRYYETRRSVVELRDRSSELYRSTFDPLRTGRIPDPLNLAIVKVAELRGGSSEGRLLNEVFTDLGAIFEQDPSMDVTLDFARYNLEGVDYTGSAPSMEAAQDFWRAWTARASVAQLANLQTAPGVGYRFDLSVRW